MSTPQEQYIESLRNGQQAVVQAMEAWSKAAQKAFGASNASASSTPDMIIDQVFDFAEQMLAMQRRFAKAVASSASAATTPSQGS
jgi:hypothetical protein